MTTASHRKTCITGTRVVIFFLICMSILTHNPLSDICAVLSAGCWLWMHTLVRLELKLIDKLNSRGK